jgi:hypothetical protein
MIIIFNKRKKRLVRRAIAIHVVNCMTNQNGKTVFNHRVANILGFTQKDIITLQEVVPSRKAKKAAKKKAKEMAQGHKVDNTQKPPKK